MRQPRAICARYSRDTATRSITPADDSPSICIICLEPLATATSQKCQMPKPISEPAVAIIKCGHIFGRNCLAQWMCESNTCPVCRVEFFEMLKPTLEEDMERPLFALGVYAGEGVLEQLSGLAIRLREDDETGIGADERIGVRSDRDRGGRLEEVWREGRQRVYYA